MDSGVLVLIGTLGGALIGAVSTLCVTWMSKRTEKRKHYRELIINLAVENYKEERSLARVLIDKRPRVKLRLYPMDMFILHMARLADLIIDKKLNPEDIKKILTEMEQISNQIYQHYDEKADAKQQQDDL